MTEHRMDSGTNSLDTSPSDDGVAEDGARIRGGGRKTSRVLTVALLVVLVAVVAVGYLLVREIVAGDVPQTLAERQIRDLTAQIKTDPTQPMPYFQLAEVYYGIKDYDKALRTIDDLRSLEVTGSALAQAEYGAARIELARGNTDAAIEGYLASLEVYELAEVRYALASAYASLERWNDAIPEYERYLYFDANDAGARARLAGAYEATGQLDKALAAYEEAARFLPDDPDVVAGLARLGGQ